LAPSKTKVAPPCPQVARTLDGEALSDEEGSVPPPVGSVEGLLDEGAGVGSPVGAGVAGEGDGLGATSAGGVEGDGSSGALGDPLGAPPEGGIDGVPVGAPVGAPPAGAVGIISASAAITMRLGPIVEAPMTSIESKNFEIFMTYTLIFLVLSCEIAYITLLNATHKILEHDERERMRKKSNTIC
jgi:hypothetical protein